MSFKNQDVMMVPDKVLKSVFPERRAIDKLLFPRGVPKSVSSDRQRVVTIVGSGVEQTKQLFQDKIDRWQQEREDWLRLNGGETEKKEILRDLELEKLRSGSNRETTTMIRLQRELSILDEKRKKETETIQQQDSSRRLHDEDHVS